MEVSFLFSGCADKDTKWFWEFNISGKPERRTGGFVWWTPTSTTLTTNPLKEASPLSSTARLSGEHWFCLLRPPRYTFDWVKKRHLRFYCRLLWSRTATVALLPCTWPQLSVVIGWAEEHLDSKCFSWKMIRLRGWMVYCSRIRFMEDSLGMPLQMIIWSRFARRRWCFL